MSLTVHGPSGTAPELGAVAARRGWHVFPCRPGDKRPAVADWERRACADPERVARYWPSARHNVGVACGPSHLVVIDLDTHGELPGDWQMPGVRDGRDVLAQLCEWADQPWPGTYMVATPSGGWHLYYQAPCGTGIRNSASLIGPMIDVRGVGGYVVGAGSVVDGCRYELLDGDGPEPLPGWLARLLTSRPDPSPFASGAVVGSAAGRRLGGLIEHVRGGTPGDRNGRLYWAARRAGEMAAAGEADLGAAGEALVLAALEAGLRGGDREARRTVASGLRGGVQ